MKHIISSPILGISAAILMMSISGCIELSPENSDPVVPISVIPDGVRVDVETGTETFVTYEDAEVSGVVTINAS